VCGYSWVPQFVTDLLCRKSMMSRNINDRYQVSRSLGVGVSCYQLRHGIFFHLTTFKPFHVALGSLAVSVLAIGRKVRGLNRGRGRWTFKSYKTRSRPSFGGEVKPSAPCRKILQHVKGPYEYEKRYFTMPLCFATS
jgi:hypothetical protein